MQTILQLHTINNSILASLFLCIILFFPSSSLFLSVLFTLSLIPFFLSFRVVQVDRARPILVSPRGSVFLLAQFSYGSLQAPWLIMIVPLGNGGDTRLSVPVPARAVTPSETLSVPASIAWPLPPDAVGKPPSRAIIALRNKERSVRLRRARLLLPLPYLRGKTFVWFPRFASSFFLLFFPTSNDHIWQLCFHSIWLKLELYNNIITIYI